MSHWFTSGDNADELSSIGTPVFLPGRDNRKATNYTRNIILVQLREDIALLTDRSYVPVFDALDEAIDAQMKWLTVTDMMAKGNTKDFAKVRASYIIRRYLKCLIREDAVGRLSRKDLVSRMEEAMEEQA